MALARRLDPAVALIVWKPALKKICDHCHPDGHSHTRKTFYQCQVEYVDLTCRGACSLWECHEANLRLEEVLKDQNTSKTAVQKLLSRTQNMGKTMLKISRNLKKFDGSLSKAAARLHQPSISEAD